MAARASRWVSATTYLQKWVVLGALLGVISGCGAIVFYEALKEATHLLLGDLAGYTPPTPTGEGGSVETSSPARPWLLPVVAGLGALAGSILVFWIAPEAEGHGTDAAIAAVHHNPRGVRFRAVLVKIVASALTIGSGGSGGREGPTGQISAGFGSLLARALDLEPADARIVVATGIGSGIGSIFGAPLGGAVLAAEILYRDDFDPTALLPSFIASGIGYLVFASVEGFSPLFGFADGYHFTHPVQLAWFALIGIIAGLVGLLYAKGFYGLIAVFARSPLPHWANPVIGGLVVGATGIAIPGVLGTGYGWIQQTLDGRLSTIPLWVVLILPFARIIATGLSIGSGGSGGIFGPGMVIGAFVGAAVWRLFEPISSSVGHDPAPYVIVGMMACFGSIARAPLAMMLMVVEMTGSVAVLAPGIVAVGLAWLIVRHFDDTMYRSQLINRNETPAARILVGLPLLRHITARQAMLPPRAVLTEPRPADTALSVMGIAGVDIAPVVDTEGRYEGTVTVEALHRLEPDQEIRAAIDASAPPVSLISTLDAVLDDLTVAPGKFVPVLDDQRRVVGTLGLSDLIRAHRNALLANLQPTPDNDNGAITHLEIAPHTDLDGAQVRNADLPAHTIILSIQRDHDTITPAGHTVLHPGDRITLLRVAPTARSLGTSNSTGPISVNTS